MFKKSAFFTAPWVWGFTAVSVRVVHPKDMWAGHRCLGLRVWHGMCMHVQGYSFSASVVHLQGFVFDDFLAAYVPAIVKTHPNAAQTFPIEDKLLHFLSGPEKVPSPSPGQ